MCGKTRILHVQICDFLWMYVNVKYGYVFVCLDVWLTWYVETKPLVFATHLKISKYMFTQYTYVYVYIHTYIHTYMHTYIHAYLHASRHTCLLFCIIV